MIRSVLSFMKISVFTACMIGSLVVFSCVPYQPEGPPPTPAETYLTARLIYNGLLSDYVDQKRLADNATKARWIEDIDPWFERAAIALSTWGAALKSGDDDATQLKMNAYLEVKNHLMQLLLMELAED